MILRLMCFVLLFIPVHAFASKKKEDPLKNNPILEKSLRLEVYRLISDLFSFDQDKLLEKMQSQKGNYTLGGCQTALDTITNFDLEKKAKGYKSSVYFVGIWKHRVVYDLLEQIEVGYVGTDIDNRRVWWFSIPFTLVIRQGVHDRKYNTIVWGRIAEKGENANSYSLYRVFPSEQGSLKPKENNFKNARHPNRDVCDGWGLAEDYKFNDDRKK